MTLTTASLHVGALVLGLAWRIRSKSSAAALPDIPCLAVCVVVSFVTSLQTGVSRAHDASMVSSVPGLLQQNISEV
eukprot:m.736714 g.736714  ORF g.736714 m.736714 type:complete len:76 (-) comp23096_c0_seq1:180-407(-)